MIESAMTMATTNPVINDEPIALLGMKCLARTRRCGRKIRSHQTALTAHYRFTARLFFSNAEFIHELRHPCLDTGVGQFGLMVFIQRKS